VGKSVAVCVHVLPRCVCMLPLGAGEALELVVPTEGIPCTSVLPALFCTEAAGEEGARPRALGCSSCLGKPELLFDLLLFA